MSAADSATPPGPTHEWVSFADPDEDRTWLFDVTFLVSSWRCVFGAGCQGVLTAPAAERAEGCCSYGAHFTDSADARRVSNVAERLTPEQWQHRSRAERQGPLKSRGRTIATRLVGGACIFLNRPGFPGGPGCALHRLALESGVSPITTKPDVCWQLPLRRQDTTEESSGHVTSTITQWDRRHWGPAGDEFHWWCTEAPEAFTADAAVYVSLADELVALVGVRPYAMVSDYLVARLAQREPPRQPVLRRARAPR